MGVGIFVTGTDTGVGKTYFACSLAAALDSKGLKVGVYKPVESGCEEKDGTLIPADASVLVKAANQNQDLTSACLYPLKAPVAPALAAEMEGIDIDPYRIVDHFHALTDQYDVTIVEGAGGILAPLYNKETALDLARRLDIPVVSVVGSKLGAINHALLTERISLEENICFIGHIINEPCHIEDPARDKNPEIIKTMSLRPVLGLLRHSNNMWHPTQDFLKNIDLQMVFPFDFEGFSI